VSAGLTSAAGCFRPVRAAFCSGVESGLVGDPERTPLLLGSQLQRLLVVLVDLLGAKDELGFASKYKRHGKEMTRGTLALLASIVCGWRKKQSRTISDALHQCRRFWNNCY